jgi:hypothetical protein
MGKMLSGLIPNSVTFWMFVETATKCLATSFCVAVPNSLDKNHSRIVSAFESVSCVVNVLEAMTKSVVSGFSFLIIC